MTQKRRRGSSQRSKSGWRWFNPVYLLRQAWRGLTGRRNRHRAAWHVNTFGWLLLAPFRLVQFAVTGLVLAFVRSWQSARWRTLWLGMPFSFAVAGSVFVALACRAAQRPVLIAQDYMNTAQQAMRAQDYTAASLYYERVLEIREGRDNDTLFMLALAAVEMKQQSRVNSILETLAPLEKAVYAPAHIMKAEMIAAKGELTREELQQVNTHLLYTVKLDPDNTEAHALLGAYYMNTQQFPLAEQHLAIAVRQRQDLLLPFAKIHALQGHTAQAAYYGGRAEEFYRQQVGGDPRNTLARLSWADATLFLEQFDRAVAILREGLELRDEEAFRQAIARVYATWSDSIKADTIEARQERLRLLETGISYNPNEPMLFDRMMIILWRDDGVSDIAREFLVSSIARGEATKLAHLLLGTLEGERGNIDQAIKHLERAYELDPSMPMVANNLAWYLLKSESIDLDKAYELVSALSARWPKMAAIHDTRGQILAKMGRWNEAATELEKSLPQQGGSVATHQAMIHVYEKLGMSDLATEHRKILKELDGENP